MSVVWGGLRIVLFSKKQFINPFRKAFMTKQESKIRILSDVDNVIDYILSYRRMNVTKLQKIVYYAYSWTLALLNQSEDNIRIKLFADSPVAWVHGPAFPNVYIKYRNCECDAITTNMKNSIDKDLSVILDLIIKTYGNFSYEYLESMTHQEDPWIKARSGLDPFESSSNIINDIDIFQYFKMLCRKNNISMLTIS